MRLGITLVVTFLFLILVGWFFTRWWHTRNLLFPASQTAFLSYPVNSSPTPSTGLGALLGHLPPLTENEKTLPLTASTPNTTGLIRYTQENSGISCTVFVLGDHLPTPLHVFVSQSGTEQDIGEMREEKGGLLIDTMLEDHRPIHFIVAPLVKGKRGQALLSGDLL